MVMTFDGPGDFRGYYNALDWLRKNGYSFGSMQRDAPIGIKKGDCLIEKWRNLSPNDRKQLDGELTGNMREGPVTLTIRGIA